MRFVGFGETPIACEFNDKFAMAWIQTSETTEIFITIINKNIEKKECYFVDFLDKSEHLTSIVYWKSKNIIVLGVNSLNNYFKLYYINEFTLNVVKNSNYNSTNLVNLFYDKTTDHLIVVGYNKNCLSLCQKKSKFDDLDSITNFIGIDSTPFIIKDDNNYIIAYQYEKNLKILIFNFLTKKITKFEKEIGNRESLYLIGDGNIDNFYIGGYYLDNGVCIYNFKHNKFISKITLKMEYMVSPELILNNNQLLISIDKFEVGLTELLELEDSEIKNSNLDIKNYSQIRFAKGKNDIIIMGTSIHNQRIFVSFIEHNSINSDFLVIQ